MLGITGRAPCDTFVCFIFISLFLIYFHFLFISFFNTVLAFESDSYSTVIVALSTYYF